ncbi:hypothetical protein [uncultured Mucilaginibacter sp.]|uniref:hypothetical protein n=1 Tax=uncultured Mucilaginibacter sp. TaxID=797541 RepID=UPI0025DF5075|nr:hypothetical protein [uncultured Mucilaginibacter sp.]
MNIDELKDAWKNDEPKGMNFRAEAAMTGKTTSAIGRIRKNMKTEFIAVLISYTMFTALMFYGLQSVLFFNLASIFMFIIIVLNSFYYFRFYVFYKSISRYDLNMQNSIRKITYELELNAEIYKTYNFCVTPLAVLITFILLCGNRGIGFIRYLLASNVFTSPWNLPIAFAVILISFIITYICINHHVRTQYGKYINELKQVMDDLGSEG